MTLKSKFTEVCLWLAESKRSIHASNFEKDRSVGQKACSLSRRCNLIQPVIAHSHFYADFNDGKNLNAMRTSCALRRRYEYARMTHRLNLLAIVTLRALRIFSRSTSHPAIGYTLTWPSAISTIARNVDFSIGSNS